MNGNLKNKLNQIKAAAVRRKQVPDDLLKMINKVIRPQLDIDNLYSQLGILSSHDAQNLLNNNVLASIRQHDLTDAESYREQKSRINDINAYYTETIHGCHTAPTVTPVTYHDVVNVINNIITEL